MKDQEYIKVYGARAHNLKNIDVKIPRDKLVVITGLSGSGKSSLAFDTIYAEGQRRYIETFSAYARQFLGGLERPDVDKIDGLSPVISIEQKTTNKSPRSTVGTITEIYDFLRLLFARAANAYSFNTEEKMVSYSDEQIRKLILKDFSNKKIAILAPLIKSRKGHYRELFEQISKQGFLRVRIDGEIKEITKGMRLDRYKTHDIEVVIDRLLVNKSIENRLEETIKTALYSGNNILMVIDIEDNNPRYFSRELMCPTSGIAYPNPEPNTFSFNSPKGACIKCNGLGITNEINIKKVIPNETISIQNGGIIPLGEQKNSWIFKQLQNIAERYKFKLSDPIKNIPKKALDIILNGGGHNMAAGFTLNKAKLKDFENYILEDFLKSNTVNNNIFSYESEVSSLAFNQDFYNDIKKLEPFGTGNSVPTFMLRELKIIKPIVLNNKHISVILKSKKGFSIKSISFNSINTKIGEHLMSYINNINVIGQINENIWNNKKTLQLTISDLIL